MKLERWGWDGTHLLGEVYGHPEWPDGHRIRTSPVLGYLEGLGVFATMSGANYALGEPDPHYLKLYGADGDVKQRLINRLKRPPNQPGGERALSE